MNSGLSARGTGAVLDLACPERTLWECLEAMPDLDTLQVSTMLSLTLGAAHSFEARSMLWSVSRVLRPGRVVETGTNHGLTANFLCKLGESVGRVPAVITYDIERSTLAPQTSRRLGIADFITFVRGDSAELLPRTCEPGVEFALIDGDHTYLGGERDWHAVGPLLAPRAVAYFDNMQHSAGCGRFFATLDPLWFHPEMSMLARGLSGGELREVFAAYVERCMSLWLGAAGGNEGHEVRRLLRELLELLGQPLADEEARHRAAALCRELSALSANAAFPASSALMEVSSRYGIGTPADAKRQRLRERVPARLLPWVSRAYRLVKLG